MSTSPPFQFRLLRWAPALLGVMAVANVTLAAATEPAWDRLSAKPVHLFHPGKASWEWLMDSSTHIGAEPFRQGLSCSACHNGQEARMGAAIVSGAHVLEPVPVKGWPGSTQIEVKTAQDGERLYFQLRWKPLPLVGERVGSDQALVSLTLDDGGSDDSARAGCWASCHDAALGVREIAVDSLLVKYLNASRQLPAQSGEIPSLKSDAEIAALLKNNHYLEYWQAAVNPGKAPRASGGYILERRHVQQPSSVSASAEFVDGHWQVSLSRALDSKGPGQKTLQSGKTYTIAFALHDGFSNHRFHYVSLEYTLRLGDGAADFVAKAP